MRNGCWCVCHCNKGSVVCPCPSCCRETEAFVSCSRFIVMAEGWGGEVLGALSASLWVLREKQIRIAQIDTKDWWTVWGKVGVKVAQRSLNFCSPFLFVLTFLLFSCWWNWALKLPVRRLSSLQMLPQLHRPAWPCAVRAGGYTITHSPAAHWGGIVWAWGVKNSPSVSGRSPTCLGERRQLLEVSVSVTFLFWYLQVLLQGVTELQVNVLSLDSVSSSIFQDWLLQAPDCGCVWEWQLPSALQRTGIRYSSVPSKGQQLELCWVRAGCRPEARWEP